MVAEEDGQRREVSIRLPPELEGGCWANFAAVSHSPYEFTLDFVRMNFEGSEPRNGVVVQRIHMSPLFVNQLIEALGDNWRKYAAKAMPKEVRD